MLLRRSTSRSSAACRTGAGAALRPGGRLVTQRSSWRHPDPCFATFSRRRGVGLAGAGAPRDDASRRRSRREGPVQGHRPHRERPICATSACSSTSSPGSSGTSSSASSWTSTASTPARTRLHTRRAQRRARRQRPRPPPDVKVPKVYWEHTARRVLTTEYIDGTKFRTSRRCSAQGIDPNQVAQIMTKAYCEQILLHGYFHADPHPGNLLVLPGPVVVFIDFGLSKDLSEEFRMNYAKLTLRDHAAGRRRDGRQPSARSASRRSRRTRSHW